MAGDHDITQAMEAEGNLQDVQTLLATMRNNREILLHCSVYMELKAKSMETLEQLQSQIAMELTRAKITVDKLTLRQQEGFLSVLPFGRNQFGDQYERVLPAGSVANMYPLSFSGKTDPKGFYVGRDKYGTNILVDLDRRSNDKTNGSALILGNSGQGKSYLMKLLLTNFRESGKAVICLDVEAEYEDLTENLGGCYVDYMTGQYIINPLEPKAWSADGDEIDEESPEAFRKVTRLSQHIAFLKDFFRSYKDFTDAQVDTMEILLEKLYAQRGITDSTDFSQLTPIQYPVMAEFYWLCQKHLYSSYLQPSCWLLYQPAGEHSPRLRQPNRWLPHRKPSRRRFRKPPKLSRPIGRKLLRTKRGKRNLPRACLITMGCCRNTMRIWETASIRFMWRWAAKSFPSSR